MESDIDIGIASELIKTSRESLSVPHLTSSLVLPFPLFPPFPSPSSTPTPASGLPHSSSFLDREPSHLEVVCALSLSGLRQPCRAASLVVEASCVHEVASPQQQSRE